MLVTVVTPVYNEESNIKKIYLEVKKIFEEISEVSYNHLFIDNNSHDQSQKILKEIAIHDKNIKVILNRSNYGHIKSPFYAIKQTNSDAVIFLVCDLQDPPSLIKDFIIKWKEGGKLILGVKRSSKENSFMFLIRKLYYKILNLISSQNLQENFLGFGLYDKEVVNYLKKIDDPEPYLRGLVIESGFEPIILEYDQNKREHGVTKNNFFTLYDLAMIGLTSYSKIPLRVAIFISFFLGIISFFVGIIYLFYNAK